MTSDLDIFRSAKLIIDEHGDDAHQHALNEAAKRTGDGRATWKRIADAIQKYQNETPDTLH
jgi:hypothetical protein